MKDSMIFAFLLVFCLYGIPQANAASSPEKSEQVMSINDVVSNARAGIDFISNDELVERVNANPRLILLDVRSKAEYDAGHLKGATWLERGVAEFTLARTLRDIDAEIIIYCQQRNRSALVAKAIAKMGYTNVKTHVGVEEWIRDGRSLHNYLGEIKVVKLRVLNAATNPIDYYQDKTIESR